MSRVPWRLTVVLLLATSAARVLALGDEITWHKTWAAAQAASQAAGKPVFAYVYQRGQGTCLDMERGTFPEAAVVEAMDRYTPLAVNCTAADSKEFCVKYGLWMQKRTEDDTSRMDASTIPAYLFLDATGREYHRAYGFYPPALLTQMLQRVDRLTSLLAQLSQKPNDARISADLGNLYLNLDRPELAPPYLNAATRQDPQNLTGARADAELDLVIISIPETPEKAFRDLVAYQYNYRQTTRGLEIRYYMAVAALADGQNTRAMRILDDFAAIPPMIPNPDKPGEQMHNPDYYKNRWCEAADLLRRGLLETPKPKPDAAPQPAGGGAGH